MAVTKTLTKAVPYNKSNKVQQWDLGMKYNQGSKSASPSTYYESEFSVSIPASETDSDGNVTNNFTPKAEGSWTKSDLTALCPVSQWDDVFASQVDSVITNPPSDPVPDESFAVPS
jgi:hypothetical protein